MVRHGSVTSQRVTQSVACRPPGNALNLTSLMRQSLSRRQSLGTTQLRYSFAHGADAVRIVNKGSSTFDIAKRTAIPYLAYSSPELIRSASFDANCNLS